MRPETLARIQRLELRARAVVEGVLVGLHRSPAKGHSAEFLQHREYVRGDDPRRVDWKVWGRQDRLYVKEYEEETNLRLTLLVDGSASMDYAGGPAAEPPRPTKYDCAATLAASLAWLALTRGDAVGCSVFDDRLRAAAPSRTRRSQATSICGVLEAPREAAAGDFRRALAAAAESLPRRGLVVVVSDLLGDRDAIFAGLRLLQARGHDLALLQVLDDDELEFPFDGPTRFEGLELPAHLACNPRALREGYLVAIGDFLADVRRRAAAIRCDHALVRTGEPLDAALVRFLARRASLAV
ncbi:MAG: DUF58 domain-containing protein [Planctomycetaceae bacterium]